ncbi:hypothetical protein AYO20_10449 [Fonsecaea nubica]|uniref:Cytochrome b561 domain-containing protein n=1 Tax=Fonsecaea nubica TaxID=856822 RepID=A0A178C8N1_9EURO|nr:hypothetical protein AYO20_10449 [Fonsecaea nubica]OAL25415.1 hypothetical protein AYO20_10449 [Fonsecaea nubica]
MKSKLLGAMIFAASAMAAATATESEQDSSLQKRAFYEDGYKIFIRKRNAHACMMSIAFIVLFPLGAISLHLPLRGVRVVKFIHAPIQILGLAVMIGAMGLGIDIADVDLNYFSSSTSTKAHVVIGLLATSALILFQPALGLLQHRYFKKTGKKSMFAYIHRWLGRIAICLGWINSGLGFQLVPISLVATHSLVRNFVIMGVLGGIWFFLIGWDGYRHHWVKKNKMSAYRLGWDKGVVLRRQQAEEEGIKEAGNSEDQVAHR